VCRGVGCVRVGAGRRRAVAWLGRWSDGRSCWRAAAGRYEAQLTRLLTLFFSFSFLHHRIVMFSTVEPEKINLKFRFFKALAAYCHCTCYSVPGVIFPTVKQIKSDC
jgi:hypothetical protein